MTVAVLVPVPLHDVLCILKKKKLKSVVYKFFKFILPLTFLRFELIA